MSHILLRLTRFSPYFLLPFIGGTLLHRVTLSFILFCYYAAHAY